MNDEKQPTSAPTPAESAPQSAPAQGGTPRSLVLSVALSEQDQDAISKLIMDYERELNEAKTLYAASLDTLKDMSAQVAQLTGAQDRMDAEIAMLTADLFRATSERDQARQDLEERCAENDRERAAHLQAYQAAVKERDEARATNDELRAEFAKSDAVKLMAELETAKRTLEAYRVRARKLYTPDVAASKVAAEEERMRDVDYRLLEATAVLKYYGLEVASGLAEGVVILVTDENKQGVKSCAYVRIIPEGRFARLTAAESELAELRKDRDELQPYARFGKEILDQAKLACAEGLIGEEHEHRLELAAKLGAGGVRREPYDPNVHQAIDCEPGDLIWSWSPLDAARNQQENRE